MVVGVGNGDEVDEVVVVIFEEFGRSGFNSSTGWSFGVGVGDRVGDRVGVGVTGLEFGSAD